MPLWFTGSRSHFGSGGWSWTAILAAALAANLWKAFLLVPRMEQIQSRIPSFEARDAHHPARREFGRLHAFSLTLNFLLMAAAAILIAAQEAFGP